jgi:hypothetical protein
MIELARRARFSHEAYGRVFVREQVRVNDFDGDSATQDALLCSIHPPHAADAEQVDHVVAAWQRAPDQAVFTRFADRADWEAARGAIVVLR